MQQEVGLKVATDGEARRSFWHYDYMGALEGLDLEERDEGVQFAGIKLRPIHPVISGKLDFPQIIRCCPITDILPIIVLSFQRFPFRGLAVVISELPAQIFATRPIRMWK